jgi:Predicted membrane protein
MYFTRTGTARTVFLAVFSAAALLTGIFDALFPLPVPGMRLGLANVFPLLALVVFGPADAVVVAALKTGLAFFLTGNVFALACSVGGTLCSLPTAILLYRYAGARLSLPAISVASAFAFNLGQMGAVVLMTGEPMIAVYLPVLLLFAAFTGFAVGALADRLSGRLRQLWKEEAKG